MKPASSHSVGYRSISRKATLSAVILNCEYALALGSVPGTNKVSSMTIALELGQVIQKIGDHRAAH